MELSKKIIANEPLSEAHILTGKANKILVQNRFVTL
ncbi:hypothetical protein CLV48_10561 [Cecembia rubra]|uniref:Uncharacterized protein n=1 Tax=Cecembia rubra TaxID=1485585 RepID=A0A2P8E4C4_9BACT|nr:hypothetical protein CLV48_10561 [Cecembia rubra]